MDVPTVLAITARTSIDLLVRSDSAKFLETAIGKFWGVKLNSQFVPQTSLVEVKSGREYAERLRCVNVVVLQILGPSLDPLEMEV
jgi:hypothetical protein